jgi:hypothetical protein
MTNEEFIKSISLDGEEWRDVIGYEGLYKVSSYSRVISLSRIVKNRYSNRNTKCKVLHPTIRSYKGRNYTSATMSLWKNNIKHTVHLHKIVALSFVPNPNNLKEIDHIDGNPLNNLHSNLKWCTHSENTNNPITRQKISLVKKGKFNTPKSLSVIQLKNGIIVNKFPSISEAVRQGFSGSKISLCCNRKRTFHKGYTWMFLSDYETLTNKSKNSFI